MSRKSTQLKGKGYEDIRKFIGAESERKKSLRSSTMAGSNDMDSDSNNPENTFMLRSLAKMEEGINAQLIEMRKQQSDNYTDVKNSLTKTEDNILKVMSSVAQEVPYLQDVALTEVLCNCRRNTRKMYNLAE